MEQEVIDGVHMLLLWLMLQHSSAQSGSQADESLYVSAVACMAPVRKIMMLTSSCKVQLACALLHTSCGDCCARIEL